MKMDILAILMVAFCLFAIGMFILFYIYAKKYHNEKNLSEDYMIDDEEEQREEIELVDLSINDKDYVFDANGYHLNRYQEIDVIINGNIFTATVIRENYKDYLDNYNQVPTKLVIKEKEEIKDEEIIVDIPEPDISYSDEEFIPKKKKIKGNE